MNPALVGATTPAGGPLAGYGIGALNVAAAEGIGDSVRLGMRRAEERRLAQKYRDLHSAGMPKAASMGPGSVLEKIRLERRRDDFKTGAKQLIGSARNKITNKFNPQASRLPAAATGSPPPM